MNKEIQKQWINALKSGQYNHGIHRLHQVGRTKDSAQFCCLGVLCELAVEAGVIKRCDDYILIDSKSGVHSIGYINSAGKVFHGFLPPEVGEWAGLHHFQNVFWDKDNVTRHLAVVNDNAGSYEPAIKEIKNL